MTFTVPSVGAPPASSSRSSSTSPTSARARQPAWTSSSTRRAMSGARVRHDPNGDVETGKRHIDTIEARRHQDARVPRSRARRPGRSSRRYLKLRPGGGARRRGNARASRSAWASAACRSRPTRSSCRPRSTCCRSRWSRRPCACSGRPGASPTRRRARCPRASSRRAKAAVTQKALAFAEAGLRVKLGQDAEGRDPRPGLRLLRRRSHRSRLRPAPAQDGGRAATSRARSGPSWPSPRPRTASSPYERELARLAASGPDFLSSRGDRSHAARTSCSPTRSAAGSCSGRAPLGIPEAAIPGGVLIPAGPPATAPLLGIVTGPTTSPYTLVRLRARPTSSSPIRAATGRTHALRSRTDAPAQIVIDLARPARRCLRRDLDGDGTFETRGHDGRRRTRSAPRARSS